MQPAPHNAIPASRALHVLMRVAEHYGAPATEAGGQRQLPFQGRIRHRQQGQVRRLRQVGQRPVAASAADLVVPRVDRVDGRPRAAVPDLCQHPAAERSGPRRSADEGDAAGLEHGPDRTVSSGQVTGAPGGAAWSGPGACVPGL
jgi:hypothetical protein